LKSWDWVIQWQTLDLDSVLWYWLRILKRLCLKDIEPNKDSLTSFISLLIFICSFMMGLGQKYLTQVRSGQPPLGSGKFPQKFKNFILGVKKSQRAVLKNTRIKDGSALYLLQVRNILGSGQDPSLIFLHNLVPVEVSCCITNLGGASYQHFLTKTKCLVDPLTHNSQGCASNLWFAHVLPL